MSGTGKQGSSVLIDCALQFLSAALIIARTRMLARRVAVAVDDTAEERLSQRSAGLAHSSGTGTRK